MALLGPNPRHISVPNLNSLSQEDHTHNETNLNLTTNLLVNPI